MMTTSYPNHAGMHPQGIPHGHPMAGPGPNPGQPGMAQMQMHPGVSGPNGPVSQAGPMMGMQPGVGPSAHALSHLQPQQAAQVFQQQQQQQHMQMNPALLQQRSQHQAFLAQQQQQQRMLAQQQHQQHQQQQGGMGMGFPANMAQGMSQQQIAALQQQAGNMGPQSFVNLPPHLRQQMQAQHPMQHQQQQTSNPQAQQAMAQAQAAHAAQLQHAQAQAQAQQAHQAQQMQQQHAIQMQHAHSQSSNHSQSGNPGPPTTTQPQQAPLRPPSAIGSHQGHSSPAPPPTPQQQQQQGPPPQQPTPVQNQPQNQPQQPSQQSQNQQMQQQRNQAMAQAAQQQAQQAPNLAQVQARMAIMQQQQQQQKQPTPGGQGTLKLLNFVDQIGKFSSARGVNKIENWQAFVDKFFSESGAFIHVLWSETSERTKLFEIVYAAIPRYFYTLFNTDVESLQITIDGAKEQANGSETKVTCDRAKFIYTYKTPCPMQIVCRGKLTAFWAGSDKLEWLQFEMENHQTFLQRSALESLFSQPSPSQIQNQSPRMNKTTAKQRQQQQRLQQPENLQPMLKKSELPSADVTDMGIPPALQSYLEIYETMNVMTSLMVHYQENSNLNPAQAMNSWVTNMSNNPALAQQQNGGNPIQGGNIPQGIQLLQGMQQPQPNMPPGARTPSGTGQPGPPNHQFMSPAMANSLLPGAVMNGSPHLMHQSHTPSPAAHAMQISHSQQGSSTTASVNTSPNVSGKRRRSTAKIDADDGGGEVNGAQKVKQSPRVGGGKRVKANNNNN